MSCLELNRWGETRILPSRTLTPTFSFRNLLYKARQFSPAKGSVKALESLDAVPCPS